jgi:hypothetical protein
VVTIRPACWIHEEASLTLASRADRRTRVQGLRAADERATGPGQIRSWPTCSRGQVRLAPSMLINPVQDLRPEVLVRKRRHQRTKMLHQRSSVSLILQNLVG